MGPHLRKVPAKKREAYSSKCLPVSRPHQDFEHQMVQPLVGENPAGTGRGTFVGLRWCIPPFDLRQQLLHLCILLKLPHLLGKDLVRPDTLLDEPPDAFFVGGPVRMPAKRPRSWPPLFFQQLHHEETVLQVGTAKPKILVKTQGAL